MVLVLRIRLLVLLIAVLAVHPARAEPILWDSFEQGFSPQWAKCAGSSAPMELDQRHVHGGSHSGLAQPNWRWSYTLCRGLPAAYDGDVYLSAWVFDDAVIAPGLPGPPDNPLWSKEHVPHAKIRLEDSGGFDYLHFGCTGRHKELNDPQWPQNIYFAADTAYEGQRLLSGPPYSSMPVRREPGWRKWTIRLKPYTGARGDAEFYLDGQLVYRGFRSSGPFGAATIDRIGLGSNIWTGEYYWYDEVEFDYWPSVSAMPSVRHALEQPDGAWVRLTGLTVDSVRRDNITVSDAEGGLIDLYPSRFQAPGDVVSVLGRLSASGPARYLDILAIEPVTTAPVVQVSSLAAARALPDGTRVKLPERVVTASLGPVRFVQESSRTCGLKIRNIYEPAIGDRVTVEGQVMTVGPEKLVEAEKVTIGTRGNPLPGAVGVPNRTLYVESGAPSGMLVVTTGSVVNRPGPSTWYPAWFEMRDGSQPADAPPVRVQLPHYSVCPQVGDYVRVKGAASWLVETAGSRPLIYTRYTSDLRVLPR